MTDSELAFETGGWCALGTGMPGGGAHAPASGSRALALAIRRFARSRDFFPGRCGLSCS